MLCALGSDVSKFSTDYLDFKKRLTRWAREHNGIVGAGVVGSYARGQQTPESDVDAVILCENPNEFVGERSWLMLFGETNEAITEHWGAVQTIRVFFRTGLEAEFNFCTISWANIPVDPGTYRAVADGFEILYDATGQLAELKQAVIDSSELRA
jgi:hypothetical protein